jgi:hypothetical protein
MNTASVFRTRELSLATFLWSKGIKYLGPETITPDSCYFTFENPDECLELEKEFITLKGKLIKSFNYGTTSNTSDTR